MGTFEDAGWFCVDNLPPGLLPALADLVLLEGWRVERAAVVCDVRGGVWFERAGAVLRRVHERAASRPRVVFLEASDESLLNRFRETRRRHPLAAGGTRLDGIVRERPRWRRARPRRRGDRHHRLSIWDLRRRARRGPDAPRSRPRVYVQFVSFGYKHGVPRDADLLFDVRFLRNPHYVPALRPAHRARAGRWPSTCAGARDGRVPRPPGGAARLPAPGLRGRRARPAW